MSAGKQIGGTSVNPICADSVSIRDRALTIGSEVLPMPEETKNALIYCAAFSVLKRLWLDGQISRQLFDRLNRMNAEKMNCKPLNP